MKRYLLPCLLLLPLSGIALAQSQTTTADWDKLSAEQRDILIAPLRARWNDASPEFRARMFDHAQHWQSMTPQQRERARHGRNRFDEMSPEQREHARAVFSHTRTLSPEERVRFHEQWRQMTPQQKEAWVRAHLPPRDPTDSK
ncbi:MAG: DUF3106 domain-containing protein [Xanthomonadaceae bacterium]|jgi:hypothetical protein|nr:DUF3106 domain-containing protein [Xanthomonadaceae bacterium]